jgi:putative ABC transport system permease protein
LVVAQVALAVTVVAAAFLLVRSLVRLQNVDMGLAADRAVLVSLSLPRAKYGERERHLQFLKMLITELESTPGIAGATPITVGPFSGTDGWELPLFTGEGQGADRVASNPSLNLESVHPNYFKTLGVALVRGRAFAESDRDGAPRVAIVSEDVAARAWPGENPLGKRIKFGGIDSSDQWKTVVGVARPTRYRELLTPRPTLYLPAEQFIVAADMVAVRTALPMGTVAPLVRQRVHLVDEDVQVMRVASFGELLDKPLAHPRFSARLIVLFGLAALVLAAVGVYAVIAATVRQRSPEIALRLALGAPSARIWNLVLGDGLKLAGLGVAIGLAASVAAERLMRGFVFEIDAIAPMSMVIASLTLIGVAALASCVPAWRAAHVDPMIALRSE